jgi:hypothetical protein
MLRSGKHSKDRSGARRRQLRRFFQKMRYSQGNQRLTVRLRRSKTRDPWLVVSWRKPREDTQIPPSANNPAWNNNVQTRSKSSAKMLSYDR